jgi:hypothetical protein
VGAAVSWLWFAAGLIVLIGTTVGVLKSLIVPRRGWALLPATVTLLVSHSFMTVARRLRSYDQADRFLGFLGPVILVSVLCTTLAAYALGFALLLVPIEDLSIAGALRESGSSITTLGFASTARAGPTVVDVIAGATGLIVIALTIGYLPSLYSIVRRREVLVKDLEGRAGSPAWGPEVLIRHELARAARSLPAFYGDWRIWAAEVADTHTKYPVLALFRLPRAPNHWLLSLLAALDAAALDLALRPDTSPGEARHLIQMGRRCMRDLADAMRIPDDDGSTGVDHLELTLPEFEDAVLRLRAVGFPMEHGVETAWPVFCRLRRTYAPIAYRLADRVVAPPTPWSGPRSLFADLEPLPYRPPGPRWADDLEEGAAPPDHRGR